MLVYCVINTVNGKRYIGVTSVALNVRWNSHTLDARNGAKTALHRAIRKYGADVFLVEQIASVAPGGDYRALLALEREIIAQEGTMVPAGYNLTAGGEGGLGYRHPPEMRAKLSVNTKAAWADPVKSAAMRNGSRDRSAAFWTEERRAERAAQIQRQRAEGRLGVGKPRGPQSAETRAKRGLAIRAFHAAKRAQHEVLQ